jgi:hypothetical protein
MAITLEYLSYSGAKDNPGGGCRAVFDFQGPDGGALYVGYTFQIGFDYEPKSAVLANNVVVEGLTGVITEVAHETASYATGKLEIYALQYGTTYNINTFDTSGTPMSDITFTPQSNNSIRAKNLVSGTLADDITTSTTNILVHIADNISAQGITDFFPTAPFYITIMPKSPTIGVANSLDSEIIKITNVDHDQVGNAALTGVRAQRDTTAKAFSTGDIVTVGVYAEDAVFLSEDGTTETESPWVNTNDIVDGSIISEKLANGAVTHAKASFTEYSTTETVIGTWIDGKPIYRKVITYVFDNSIPSGVTSIPHNISGVSEIIGIDTMYQLGWDKTTYGDESYLAMNGYQVIAGNQNINIINVGQNSWSGKFKFILSYTKTTD